jgi:hypothetical protein
MSDFQTGRAARFYVGQRQTLRREASHWLADALASAILGNNLLFEIIAGALGVVVLTVKLANELTDLARKWLPQRKPNDKSKS